MPHESYNVPLIQPDLRREEMILQIADALDYLDKVSNDIFNRISNKVTENRQKLQSINERINTAQAKVDHIKGSKKAIKVFSSAKYPAADSLDSYTSAFKDQNNLKEIRHPHRHIQSKHQSLDDRALKEKLQFYNVHLKIRQKDNDDSGEGLGSLPSNLSSVSSLLLYNTRENP